MAVLPNGMVFDASQVAPASGYEALPAGWYTTIIVGSEFKNTSNNTGTMMVLERKVVANDANDPTLNGRTFLQRLNLVNPSDVASRIAASELSSICHVTGVIKLTDTTQLHNIPHRVRLDADDTTSASGNPIKTNNVKEYQDMHGNGPGKVGQSGPAQPHPAPQATAQAPAHAPPSTWNAPTGQPAAPPAAAGGWGAPPATAASPAPAVSAPATGAPAWGAPQQGTAQPAAWGAPPR